MTFYTKQWVKFGDLNLRKNQIGLMSWFDYISLKNCTICYSKFAGPIAVIKKNSSELQFNKINYQEKLLIEIFNSFGYKLSEIYWTNKNDDILKYFDWSYEGELFCITSKGNVFVYDINGVIKSTFKIDQNVKECKFFIKNREFGFIILNENNKFFSFSSTNKFKIFKYPELPKTFLYPNFNFTWNTGTFTSSCPDIIVTSETEIYLLSFIRPNYSQLRYTFNLKNVKINLIASTIDKNFISVYLSDGTIIFNHLNGLNLVTTHEFKTNSSIIPNNFLWFCEQALCVTWNDIILILNEKNHKVTFSIDDKITYFFISERDGLRIISEQEHDFLEFLPKDVYDVFNLGSEKEGAYLLEAFNNFVSHKHSAVSNIKFLTDEFSLQSAIQQCINAAQSEFKTTIQKLLLRAACFGKCFLSEFDSTEYINTILQLRVLNMLRKEKLGIPLSYEQYKYFGINLIIKRLLKLEKFGLVYEISEYLKIDENIGKNQILKEWAFYKIKQYDVDEKKIATDILNKIGNIVDLPYSLIANLAIEYKRENLALCLIEYETNSNDQVDLLLKLGNNEEALNKATQSCNTNLIYKVILSKNFKDYFSSAFNDFLKVNTQAYKLYEKYLKVTDTFELTNFYHTDKRTLDTGLCYLKECFLGEKLNNSDYLKKVQLALDSFKLSDNEFLTANTEEHLRLLNRQKKLEEKLKEVKLFGLSLYDTIKNLLSHQFARQADELRKEFKFNEKKFYFLKIDVLSSHQQWKELHEFSLLKKTSPVGYEPFVDACLFYKNKSEAQKYLSKVKDENKVNYFMKFGMLEEAVIVASEQKNISALNQLKELNKNIILDKKIETILNELKRN